MTRSIKFWLKLGVDGFMINGLELLPLPQSNVSAYITDWRKILLDGSRKSQKILAVPAELLENVDEEEDGVGLRKSILRWNKYWNRYWNKYWNNDSNTLISWEPLLTE